MESHEKDLFICHASEDKETVIRPLVEAFDRAGISCWLDEAEIHWGDSITKKVNEGLRISKYVVVVISDAFIQKPWPQRELNAVLNIEAATGEVKVLPLFIGSQEQVIMEFRATFPLLNDKFYLSWDGNLRKVVEAIQGRLHRKALRLGDQFTVAAPILIEKEKSRKSPIMENQVVAEKNVWPMPGDKSEFIKDVTIPDGTFLKKGTRFIKTWEIFNSGTETWRNRYLKRMGACEGIGLISSPEKIPIPDTPPGRTVMITIPLVAPDVATTTTAIWKMIDEHGSLCFPDRYRYGLAVTINVFE